jgi:hypothetical protein
MYVEQTVYKTFPVRGDMFSSLNMALLKELEIPFSNSIDIVAPLALGVRASSYATASSVGPTSSAHRVS